ncbi:MAG: hypothetical protein ACK5MQ_14780 [Pikeienuella sp.]
MIGARDAPPRWGLNMTATNGRIGRILLRALLASGLAAPVQAEPICNRRELAYGFFHPDTEGSSVRFATVAGEELSFLLNNGEECRYPIAADATDDPSGVYVSEDLPDAVISIERQGGEYVITGDASHENNAGAISVGVFSGAGSLDENTRRGRADHIPLNGDPDNGCYLDIRLLGRLMIVLDSGSTLGNCGGQGVSFTGVYRKTR